MDRFGLEFIEAAGKKTMADAEEMARAKLCSLPDGVWRSRVYYSARKADQSDADILRREQIANRRAPVITPAGVRDR